MKKILLLSGLALAAYSLFAQKDNDGSDTQPDFFSQYNGKLIADVNDIWMVVKNGKIYNVTESGLKTYLAENPGYQIIRVAQDIWKANIAAGNTEMFGGPY